MRSRIVLGAAIVAAGVLKGALWTTWIPPGALPEETGQYLTIARTREALDPAMQSLAPKDMAELARFAQVQQGRLPVRSDLDLRKLNATLASITDAVFVPAEVSSPPASSYHSLKGRLLFSLLRLDIRWRWSLLRLLNTAGLALAAILTSIALSAGVSALAASLAGMALVMYGPASGMGAGLLGPSAFVAVLWGAWLVCMVQARTSWQGLPWAALVGLAMSSVDVQGGVACAVTAAAAAWSPAQGRRFRIGRWGAVIAGLLGGALWVFRLLTSHQAYPATEWETTLFGTPPIMLPAPPVLLAGWGVVAAVALAGLAVRVRKGRLPMAGVVAGALLLSLVVGRLFPTPGMTGLSISPLMAYLVVHGWTGLWPRPAGYALLVSVVIALDLAALIAWVIPRLFA